MAPDAARPRVFMGVAVAAGAGLLLAGCGDSHAAGGRAGGAVARSYPVKVVAAFRAGQRLGQRSDLKIAVTNAGSRAIPDVTVTLTNPRDGTGADALSTLIAGGQPTGGQPLASRSRPVWVIDREPGPCHYNCHGGTGAASSDVDTWALGRLAAGRTARFDWRVTAVRAGRYAVAYRVAAGAGPGLRAVLTGGGAARGRFFVRIDGRPAQQRFTASGRVVSLRRGK